MLRRFKKWLFVALAVVMLTSLVLNGCASQPESAKPVEPAKSETAKSEPTPDFPTKPITWIVPYGPGGGFDVQARIYAKGMEKVLGVPVVVENLEGAGGRTGWIRLEESKPDGYTIGSYNVPGGYISQILDPGRFDYNKVSWIGRTNAQPYQLFVAANGPFKSLKDLQEAKQPVRFASQGLGSTGWAVTVLATSALKIPHTRVLGYANAVETAVAVMRGEADAVSTTIDTPAILEYVKSGDLAVIAVFSEERDKNVPNIQTAGELGYPELSKFQSNFSVGAPPGVPDSIMVILRDAFEKASKDEELLETFKKAGTWPIYPLVGEEFETLMADNFALVDQYKDEFKRAASQ